MYHRISYQASAVLVFMFIFFSSGGSAGATALSWNTFWGGSGDDEPHGIAVDASGNVFVAGRSSASWGEPLRAYSGDRDAVVAKFDRTGALVWHTFLGGSGTDIAFHLTLDSSGNIYAGGASYATWGSPQNPYIGSGDAFIAKLDSSGQLVWNTFCGSSGQEYALGLALDASGNIYAAGTGEATWGAPVRTFTGSYDGFVAKFDSSGALLWNTFLGGGDMDGIWRVAVDGSGTIYAAGDSSADWGSSPIRAYSGGSDAFAAKLDSSGNLLWNTFLGTSGYDDGFDLALDGSGNIYIPGVSDATWGSPIRARAGANDGFVAKINSSGALVWNTFLGGGDNDECYGITLDASGNIYTGGRSYATWGTPLLPYTVNRAAFAARLDSSGALVWNTFLGDSLDEASGYVRVAVNSFGNVYAASYSRVTWGTPVRPYTVGREGYIARISQTPATQADNVTADPLITDADIFWRRGSGEKCVVFIKEGDNGSAAPVDGSTPAANAAFGAGSEIPSTGWFCVYNGMGDNVTVTGLSPEITYQVMVCEYNGAATKEQYNRSSGGGNPASFTTLCELTVIPKNLHKLLSFAEPIKVFVLIGSADTVFDSDDVPSWDTAAIKPLLKLKIGQRVVLSFVFVNPFALAAPSEALVTIGDCLGGVQVKPL